MITQGVLLLIPLPVLVPPPSVQHQVKLEEQPQEPEHLVEPEEHQEEPQEQPEEPEEHPESGEHPEEPQEHPEEAEEQPVEPDLKLQ